MLFCCLVLSFGLFSVTANAESLDTETYKLNYYSFENNHFSGLGQADINVGDVSMTPISHTKTFGTGKTYTFRQRLTFVDKAGSAMFKKGKQYTFTANNLYFELQIADIDITTAIHNLYNVKLIYVDGSEEYVNDKKHFNYNTSNHLYSVSATFTPKQDVYKIVFYVNTDFTSAELKSKGVPLDVKSSLLIYIGTGTDYALGLDVSVQSEESTLLGGIWDTLSGGFSSLVDGIANLPNKIWEFIENGLKNLFVPDEEYITGYKDRWESLLSEKLGAVYQVVNITFESWDKITASDQTNTISIPSVTIPLGKTSFTFGGYDVAIVPEGFDWLATSIKALLGGLCTILFINGLRKRYDEIMGVEQ